MSITHGEREELAAARLRVWELEAKEAKALQHLENALRLAPSLARNANWDAADIAKHADAIRDALEPFNSSVRCKENT